MRRRPFLLNDGLGIGIDFSRGVKEGVAEKSQSEHGQMLERVFLRARPEVDLDGLSSTHYRVGHFLFARLFVLLFL